MIQVDVGLLSVRWVEYATTLSISPLIGFSLGKILNYFLEDFIPNVFSLLSLCNSY